MGHFYSSSLQKNGRRTLRRCPPEKLYFEIFPKPNAVSITFEPRYIHGQSLKEIEFPSQNEVDG